MKGRVRSRWLWWWSLAAVVAVCGAFLVGTYVRSPWEEAAQNASVRPVVLVEVEHLELPAERMTVPAVVSSGVAADITITPSDTARSIVTQVATKVGESIASGELIGVVSGTPVIALSLPFPLYRDLGIGESGPDVEALQRALADIELYDGAVDGVYGPATAHAVERLFTRAGVDPPDEGGTDRADRDAESDMASVDKPGDHERPSSSQSVAASEPDPRPGDQLPISTIARLSGAAVAVDYVAAVGDVLGADDPLARVHVGSPYASARVGVDQSAAVAVGSRVEVRAVGGDTNVVGTVTSQSAFRPGEEGQVPGYDIEIALPVDAALQDGQEVSLVIDGDGSAYEGLGVPMTAVREGAPGAYVERVTVDGGTERVAVDVTGAREGYALIDAPALSVGDRVSVPS